jgi:hypothetical protein
MTDVNFFRTTHEGGYADIVALIRKKGGKRKNEKLDELLKSGLPDGIVANGIQSLLTEMGYSEYLLPSKKWRIPCSEWKRGKIPPAIIVDPSVLVEEEYVEPGENNE